MDIKLFMDKFHEMELKYKLFEHSINGVLPWDKIRHDVFYLTYKKLCKVEVKCGFVGRRSFFLRLIKKLIYGICRFIIISTIFILRSKILVLKCSREYVSDTGLYRDSIMQPVIELLEANYFEIETNPNVKTLYHSKFIFKHTLKKKDSKRLKEFINEIDTMIYDVFNVEIASQEIIYTCFEQFVSEKVFYNKLFKLTKIKHVYFIQNGINKGLLKVANEKNVKLYELQHGYIGFGHPAYSYPKLSSNVQNIYLPDVFLTFGAIWNQDLNYPVKEKYVLGSNNHKVEKLSAGAKSKLLVISGDIYQELLEELTKNIAMAKPSLKILFKLHPNQVSDYKRIKLNFHKYINVKVIFNEQDISSCLRDCYNILCIQSTVAYEAINAGRRVFCYQRLDYNIMSNLSGFPNLILINNLEDFLDFWSPEEDEFVNNPLPYNIYTDFKPSVIHHIQSFIR